jgi:hypothetical protein
MSDGTEADETVKGWLRETAGWPGEMTINLREEPHCPDPACPLRRTVLTWTDAHGGERTAIIVKPLAYVRPGDVQRAWRTVNLGH